MHLIHVNQHFFDVDWLVGRELQKQLKPVRTTAVANRLIGAALGIRIPRKVEKKVENTQATESQVNSNT